MKTNTKKRTFSQGCLILLLAGGLAGCDDLSVESAKEKVISEYPNSEVTRLRSGKKFTFIVKRKGGEVICVELTNATNNHISGEQMLFSADGS